MGWMRNWDRLTKLCAQLKSELGEESYNNLWKVGELLDMEDTIQDLIDEFSVTDMAQANSGAEFLTNQELNVLPLLCKGYSHSKIADMLTIGRVTVSSHARNMRRKLNEKNTTELIIIARKLNIIDDDCEVLQSE